MLGASSQHLDDSDRHQNGLETTTPKTESLLSICNALRSKILSFLEENHKDDKRLLSLQGHVRVAMQVTEEALRRYG